MTTKQFIKNTALLATACLTFISLNAKSAGKLATFKPFKQNKNFSAYFSSSTNLIADKNNSERILGPPDTLKHFMSLGQAAYDSGQYKMAIGHFEAALQYAKTDSARSEICTSIALAYLQEKNIASAMMYFSNAMKANSFASKNFYGMSACHLELFDIKNALSFITMAIELDPVNDFYYEQRAQMHSMLWDYASALRDISTAINYNPAEAIYYGERGNFHVAMGEYGEAFNDFKSALIQANSENIEYYKGFVDASKHLGNLQPCLDFLLLRNQNHPSEECRNAIAKVYSLMRNQGEQKK